MKLVNGTFNTGLLYKYENGTIKLYKSIGNFDYNSIHRNHLIRIPIFINGVLKYTLNLISKKNVIMTKLRLEIIEILRKYLE